jgi:hypothetical protein
VRSKTNTCDLLEDIYLPIWDMGDIMIFFGLRMGIQDLTMVQGGNLDLHS